MGQVTDLLIYETGNGGDLRLLSADLETITGYENMPYLLMFGGSSWLGNEVMQDGQQVDSKTDKALRTYALNSAGRIEIEKAINADLERISQNVPGTVITVSTQILNNNEVGIKFTIDGKLFSYKWHPSSAFLNYQI